MILVKVLMLVVHRGGLWQWNGRFSLYVLMLLGCYKELNWSCLKEYNEIFKDKELNKSLKFLTAGNQARHNGANL